MEKVSFNGIDIYAADSRNELIRFALENKKILVAVNAEKISNATKETIDIINRNVGYADGYGAVLALQSKGCANAIKIPGCELWLNIVEQYHALCSFYFIGGNEETIEKTISKLYELYPKMNIVGHHNGYFDTNSERAILNDVVEKKPDVVFVAMGSPKQEYFMEKASCNHSALYQGLGGSFDVFVGNVKRAPKFWVQLNLEWLYRLLQEPRRFKRQLKLFGFVGRLKLGLANKQKN